MTTDSRNGPDPLAARSQCELGEAGLRAVLRRDIQRALDPECRRALTIWRVVLQLLLSPELRLVVLFRLYSWLGDHGPYLPAYVVYMMTRGRTGCDLALGARIGPGLRLDHRSDIVIGTTVVAGSDLTVYNGVSVGKRRPPLEHDMPILGDRVTISTGAKVLGALRVGDDSVVAANAVVLADVSPGTTVAGIPARPVGSAASRRGGVGAGSSAGVAPDF